MSETATLVLAIIGAVIVWTTSIIGGIIWLTGKFRGLERALYRETDKHRRENDALFTNHLVRIQRLEIKAFGFTGTNGGAMIQEER